MSHRNLDNLEPYRHLLSLTDLAQIEASIQRPLLPDLRINTLKIGVDEARQAWPAWYGWDVQPLPFCSTGWRIADGGAELSRTIEHRMGFYYIQDAASMLPAEMFRFEEESRPLVLDMAASPGGKTTHLACKINDTGLIIANDTSGGRIGALRSNLQDWGAISTAITNYPGERFGNWFPEVFDKVLLDAPCSGESLRTAERRKSRPVSTKEREQLHQRQARLLTSAFQALKPGGQVAYATCTLAPEEDEAVVEALLNLYPQQATVEAVDRILPIPAPGLASDGERAFHPQVPRAVRLWPHLYDTSGFF
ncbi:MAG: NOL1/NOP2/sun family putative RNA methylase, partial [Anaerolineae bacterium]